MAEPEHDLDRVDERTEVRRTSVIAWVVIIPLTAIAYLAVLVSFGFVYAPIAAALVLAIGIGWQVAYLRRHGGTRAMTGRHA